MENSSSDQITVEPVDAEVSEQKPQVSSVEPQVSSAEFKNAASPYTALTESLQEGVGGGPSKMRFFGPRFMAIWVMPMALTGIVMEFLFVSPLRNINPFN